MNRRTQAVLGAVLLGFVVAYYSVQTYLIGPYAWDDGAITIAFARSLRAGGEFALTLASERVEGTSSLLYTLLIAFFIPVSESRFEQQIATSQALTAVALVALAVVVFRALRVVVPSVLERMVILSLFLLVPMHLSETMNGMEMELFALLLTLFAIAVRSGARSVHVIIPLCLLTRFEGAFYLGFAAASLILFDPGRRRYHVGVLASTVVCFALLTGFRLIYFGDLVPNTIWAKMSPPYTPDHPFLEAMIWRVGGIAEMITCAAPLLLVAGVSAAYGRKFPTKDPCIWIIAGFAVFALITGPNLGYPGRMFVGMLPLALIVTVELLAGHERAAEGPRAGRGQISIVIGALVSTILVNAPLAISNVTVPLKAGLDRDLIPDALEPAIAQRVGNLRLQIVPWEYRLTGLHADAIRKMLDLETLVFMVPDVGGSSLCCDPHALAIVDSALLTNVSLAKSGYTVFEQELRMRNPDLIETHSIWAEVSHTYESPHFRNEYRPVIYGNTMFWLRSDLLGVLYGRYPERVSEASGDLDYARLRNDFNETDFAYLTKINRHPVVVISED
jgi:hypothetical protein